jgi:hypothetical protein
MADNTVLGQEDTQPTEPNSETIQPASETEFDYEAMNPTGVFIIKKLRENINAGPFLEPVLVS